MGKSTSAGLAASAAMVTAGLAGHAAAQGLPPEPVTEISASLDVRHDSNVARTSADRASARGLTPSDQRATPAINIVYSRPLGRNTVSLNASAGYDFYRNNPRLNRERLSLGAIGAAMAGPLTFDLSTDFKRSQSDPADLAPLAIPGVNSIRNTQTTQDYNAKVRLGSQPYGFKPVASFGYSQGNNSNPRRRLSNYNSKTYGGGISYESPVVGYWDLQFLRSDVDYPDRDTVLLPSGFKTDRVTLSGRRDLGAVLVANGSVSWISLKPGQRAGGAVESFNSIGYSLGLTAVPTPNMRLSGSFLRNVGPSLGTDALYQVSNVYTATAAYALSSDISFRLTGTISDMKYVGAGQVFSLALFDSVQRSVTAGVDLAQTRPLRVGFDVGYLQRDANGTFFDYNSFYAGIRTSFRLRR